VSDGRASTGQYIAYGVIAAVIFSAIALSLNQLSGPIGDTRGIVESAGYLPATKVTPPVQRVSVRLGDGSLIQANVVGSVAVRPGQVARVRIYRRIITGGRNYEVIDADQSK
jgi:hypothetical protein